MQTTDSGRRSPADFLRMNWMASGFPEPADIVEQARAYRHQDWPVFCCTAFVGSNNDPEGYAEPTWLIAAIEYEGWHLERLEYLCVDLERTEHTLGGGFRVSSRIEAKLMFRRQPDSAPNPPTPATREGDDR